MNMPSREGWAWILLALALIAVICMIAWKLTGG